jgi:hypothetical protein
LLLREAGDVIATLRDSVDDGLGLQIADDLEFWGWRELNVISILLLLIEAVLLRNAHYDSGLNVHVSQILILMRTLVQLFWRRSAGARLALGSLSGVCFARAGLPGAALHLSVLLEHPERLRLLDFP